MMYPGWYRSHSWKRVRDIKQPLFFVRISRKRPREGLFAQKHAILLIFRENEALSAYKDSKQRQILQVELHSRGIALQEPSHKIWGCLYWRPVQHTVRIKLQVKEKLIWNQRNEPQTIQKGMVRLHQRFERVLLCIKKIQATHTFL